VLIAHHIEACLQQFDNCVMPTIQFVLIARGRKNTIELHCGAARSMSQKL
jgi:hypothetical protein